MMAFKFNLKDNVIDILSGFKDMIIARSEYLFEDSMYRIQPKFDKYTNNESKWITEGKLELK